MMNKLTIATTIFVLASASGVTANGQSGKQIKVQKFTEYSKYISGMAIAHAKLYLRRAGLSYGSGTADKQGHFRFRLKGKLRGTWRYTLVAKKYGHRTIKIIVSPTISKAKKDIRKRMPVSQPQLQPATPPQMGSNLQQAQSSQQSQPISQMPQTNKPVVNSTPMKDDQSRSTMSPEFADHLNDLIMGRKSVAFPAGNNIVSNSNDNGTDNYSNWTEIDQLESQRDELDAKLSNLCDEKSQTSEMADEYEEEQELLEESESDIQQLVQKWQDQVNKDNESDSYGDLIDDSKYLTMAKNNIVKRRQLVASGASVDQIKKNEAAQIKRCRYLEVDIDKLADQIGAIDNKIKQLQNN